MLDMLGIMPVIKQTLVLAKLIFIHHIIILTLFADKI